ncbi:MAG TPA: hypothetical protein VHT28_00255 [Silvibacterium sp.]|jgi:hypothetical protein|nr:hypothetical protein [Silvibacterium sp.]
MESPNLLALIAKREEFRKGIRLLEAKPSSVSEFEAKRLIARLRLMAERLDKRIEMEAKTPRTEHAA